MTTRSGQPRPFSTTYSISPKVRDGLGAIKAELAGERQREVAMNEVFEMFVDHFARMREIKLIMEGERNREIPYSEVMMLLVEHWERT